VREEKQTLPNLFARLRKEELEKQHKEPSKQQASQSVAFLANNGGGKPKYGNNSAMAITAMVTAMAITEATASAGHLTKQRWLS